MVHKEFQFGEHVYLRVRTKNISLNIKSWENLAPWFFGPFEILERIDPVALPPSINVHDVFHLGSSP